MQASEFAWQPLTPGGVAAFACARRVNLFTVQTVVALIAAAAVLWFVSSAWFPVVSSAIRQLPPGAAIRGGRLAWPVEPATMLAENHFLAIGVDLQHKGQVRSPAHIDVELGASNVRVFSLLGLIQFDYGTKWSVPLTRENLEPWWGAWAPMFLAVLALAVLVWLFLIWAVLATVYCPAAWLVGFFADRELTLRGAWRLSGAALMPSALFLIIGIVLYGLGVLDVVRLLAVGVAHLVIGWVYVVAAPLWCPKQSTMPKGNPFTSAGGGPVGEAVPGQGTGPEGSQPEA